MIDSHQHFWKLSRGDYPWLTPDIGPIYRDYCPVDIEPHLMAAGISRTILVQAAPTVDETQYLLELAEENEFIAGVVGWVDFDANNVCEAISEIAPHPKLLGLRPMVQDLADDEWLLRRRIEPAFSTMIECNLRFDALVRPKHLTVLNTLLDRHPSLDAVIDHCAKPDIANGGFTPWATAMRHIAQSTNAYCKLSGLLTEAGPNATAAMLQPYVDHVLDVFGAERVMWGSDWPVLELAGNYKDWRADTLEMLKELTEQQRNAVLAETASDFYRLEQHTGQRIVG